MSNVNINNVKNYLFYKVPKCILNNEPYKTKLSPLAKLGYIFILDRLSLSISNKWIDKKGDVFIYYSRQDLQNDLPTTKKTAISIFKQLEELNLIHQFTQGKGLAYKIYVEDIFNQEYEVKKVVENSQQSSVKNTPVLVENLHPNNNKGNNNENYISSSIDLNKIKESCNLSKFYNTILKTGVSIGSLFNSTIDTLFYLPKLQLDNKEYTQSDIRELLSNLTEQHLNKVENIFIKNYENVRNYKSYLITCICNTILEKEIPTNMISKKEKTINKHYGREYSEEFFESLYDNVIYKEESQELEL